MLDSFILTAEGVLVGLSLGLTGGGGSILAVPLLVYGGGVDVPAAMTMSLMMVVCIAFLGGVRQGIERHVDWKVAVLFSLSGMVVAPLVVYAAAAFNNTLRLILLAVLMLFVAYRLVRPQTSPKRQGADRQSEAGSQSGFDLFKIGLGGILAGALSGFFGVGGGFVVVPLLTLLFQMPYRKAVGTSLVSIFLISLTGVAGAFTKEIALDWAAFGLFVLGGILGIGIGSIALNKIPERASKILFAAITSLFALFILLDKLVYHHGGNI